MSDTFTDGREAERLLQDPGFQKAMQRLENDAVANWKMATDAAKREACHAQYRAVEGLREALQAMQSDKKLAELDERPIRKVE